VPVNFRVQNRNSWEWNPYNDEITKLFQFSNSETDTKIPIELATWESAIIVFEEGMPAPHVTESNLDKIVEIAGNTVSAEVLKNSSYFVYITNDADETFITREISDVPSFCDQWKLEVDVGK